MAHFQLILRRITASIFFTTTLTLATAQVTTSTAPRQPVPFTAVKLEGGFWGPRQQTNRTVSIPHSLKMLEKAGNIYDLDLAAADSRTGYKGPIFIDSDLYKAIEAASYSLATNPDPELEKQLDTIIAKIAAAQQPDGYLNTHFQVVEPDKKWTNLRDAHELYCAGHLIEAAVAHYQATGKRTLLNVAVQFANLIDSIFGDEPGKRAGYPGHEEIELALYKLARVTGDQRYYRLADFFLLHRGTGFFAREHNTPMDKYDGTHWQDNVPLADQQKIVGHAVRAGYLLSAATDYTARTGDPAILSMLDRVWKNTTGANQYVTGGIGSSAVNEGFTTDYDLPNLTAYQETCASVAMILWNHRLALLSGDTKYIDNMERALYNGFLAGVSLDGTRFFYVNPLASNGNHHRREWYGTACCPPNVGRTLASLGGYAYATSPDTLWVNLFLQGTVNADVPATDTTSPTVSTRKIAMEVNTNYPWDGEVRLKFHQPVAAPFTLKLRQPNWCTSASLALNGSALPSKLEKGYITVAGPFNNGDELTYTLEMPVRQVTANPKVVADAGRLALQRGPLVYCLEDADNTSAVKQMAIPTQDTFTTRWQPDLLGGIVSISGAAIIPDSAAAQEPNQLYAPVAARSNATFTAIPYYAWDNRTPGAMAVWLPNLPTPPSFKTVESQASVTMSFVSWNCSPGGANDGIEPAKSSDQPTENCHWWPHKGTDEWVQYTWDKPQTISGCRVYWFDDTGRGECRVPAEWHIEYQDDSGNWHAVTNPGDGAKKRDGYNAVHFPPVSTKALRLALKLQPGFAAGVHEWQVTSN